jgi:SRSO17 transposase
MESELDRYLERLASVLGHADRRAGLREYCRGLMLPIHRKSVEPLAAHIEPQRVRAKHQSLHHFVAKSAWSDAAVLREVRAVVQPVLGLEHGAYWIIDDTGLPKQGRHSVGVARQYCGQLGKQANCQSLVSLTLACHEVPVPVGLRLFLPKVWTDDTARCAAAGVPKTVREPRTKPEIALAEIDRVIEAGVRFGCVLADAGYGLGAPFRQGLSARGLTWSVGVPRTQKVYTTDAKPIWPNAGRGRPRKQPVPSEVGQDAASALADRPWRRVAWRQGTKGMLAARFAVLRVRVADGAIAAVSEGRADGA